jgi:TRAP-type C4-dicarboxylate transport system permease small subunit
MKQFQIIKGWDMKNIEETKVWNVVLKIERFIIISASWLCTLIIVLGVCLRYLFNADLFGIEEFLIIIAFWLYFMGAAYGSYEGSHIRADILMIFVKNKKTMKILRLIELSTSTFAAAVFTFWGFQLLHSSIFFGFLLMFVYFFVHLIRAAKNKN